MIDLTEKQRRMARIRETDLFLSGEEFTAEAMAKELGAGFLRIKDDLADMRMHEEIKTRKESINHRTNMYYWRRNKIQLGRIAWGPLPKAAA